MKYEQKYRVLLMSLLLLGCFSTTVAVDILTRDTTKEEMQQTNLEESKKSKYGLECLTYTHSNIKHCSLKRLDNQSRTNFEIRT